MSRKSRKTESQWKVLKALSEQSDDELHGLRICRLTGLKSGTVYPMLREFESRGLVKRWVEDIDPVAVGRPRRTFYRLLPPGQSIVDDYQSVAGMKNWEPLRA